MFFFVFQFNAAGPLSDANPGYNKSPSLDDRVHVLVCVLSANSAEITDSVLRKMAEVREMARDLGKINDNYSVHSQFCRVLIFLLYKKDHLQKLHPAENTEFTQSVCANCFNLI